MSPSSSLGCSHHVTECPAFFGMWMKANFFESLMMLNQAVLDVFRAWPVQRYDRIALYACAMTGDEVHVVVLLLAMLMLDELEGDTLVLDPVYVDPPAKGT